MNKCGIVALTTAGVVLLILGVVMPLVFPSILSSKLEEKLILREDSPTIGNFISPPVPIFMQFYIFNVTNPDDVLNGSTPILDQIGPFTYEETRAKHSLLWEEHDATVTYRQNKTFFFRSDLSNGLTEDTEITFLNPVAMTLAAKVQETSWFSPLRAAANAFRTRYDLSVFITRKAGDLLFKGYREEIFDGLAPLTGKELHLSGKFGFFFPKNHTDGGTYRVYTGAEGLDTLQVIDEYKGHSNLDYWPTDECNMINGTEGSQFPQPITEEKRMYMYSADLCRSLYLKFEKRVQHGDLELLRFVLPYEVLAKSPENDCYCTDDFTCKDSMVNLSPCKDGSPIVASTPHFYMGKPETINAVQGLNPSKSEHETYLDIEPNTGVTFRAHKRLQVNIPLKQYSLLEELDNVQEVIMPVLWLNESAVVPEVRANALYSKLTMPAIIVNYVCVAMLILGTILLLVALWFAVKLCRSTSVPTDEPEQEKLRTLSDNEPEKENEKAEPYKHLYT